MDYFIMINYTKNGHSVDGYAMIPEEISVEEAEKLMRERKAIRLSKEYSNELYNKGKNIESDNWDIDEELEVSKNNEVKNVI